MGKLSRHLFMPPPGEPESDHPPDEELAQLAEGSLDAGKRQAVLAHVNSCRRCYEILTGTLDALEDGQSSDKAWFSRLNRVHYSVAASIIVALFVTVGLFQQQAESPRMVMASLTVDGEMKALLMENSNLDWRDSGRIGRLALLLRKRGIETRELKRVIMDRKYLPTKSLFGPPEVVKITIENGVARISVERPSRKRTDE